MDVANVSLALALSHAHVRLPLYDIPVYFAVVAAG